MSSVAESIDYLRGRFMRHKGVTPYEVLAKDISVSPVTLNNFGRGREVSQRTLLVIEAWVQQREAKERP